MARIDKPKKTSKPNIYISVNKKGENEYLATWTQDGRRYIEKNLTRSFGSTTLTQAEKKLSELKVLLSRGENPFKKEKSDQQIPTIQEHVLNEIDDRSASVEYKYMQKKIFLKHVAPIIGNIHIDKLTQEDVLGLFRKLKKTEQDGTISNIKKTLTPTFDIAVEEGILKYNPLHSTKLKRLTKKSKKMEQSQVVS